MMLSFFCISQYKAYSFWCSAMDTLKSFVCWVAQIKHEFYLYALLSLFTHLHVSLFVIGKCTVV